MSHSPQRPICLNCIHSRVQSRITEVTDKDQQFAILMASVCAQSTNLSIELITGQESFDSCVNTRKDNSKCGIDGAWFETIPSPVSNPIEDVPFIEPTTLQSIVSNRIIEDNQNPNNSP